MKKTEERELYSEHEEADTRMIFHLSMLPSNTSNVVARTADTDVMAILLGNIHNMNSTFNIWMESGVHSKIRYDISTFLPFQKSLEKLFVNLFRDVTHSLDVIFRLRFPARENSAHLVYLSKTRKGSWHLLISGSPNRFRTM